MRSFRIVAIVVASITMTLAASAQTASVADEEAAVRAAALRELDGWTKFDPAQELGRQSDVCILGSG